jgi:tRNA(Arg) A34 adenosine deaminase TadA
MYDETFMRRAIALSEQALGEPGAGPFAAVIVRAGAIVGEGINRSRAKYDPTSHGEVEAIRDACGRLKTVDLSGCDLYTTCEPCTMCVATMLIAGIGRMYYGASAQQSGAIVSRFRAIASDDLQREVGLPVGERRMPAEQKLAAEAMVVLETWADAAPGRRA